MNSKICTGYVLHERYEKSRHGFRYPVYFYALDLDELPQLDRSVLGFGYNRFSMVSLYDGDYLERGPGSIRTKLLRYLSSSGLDQIVKRIVLVTCARTLSHVFNPVSFYYCYGEKETLACVVMEVNNTFDEKHLYLLERKTPGDSNGTFHVSTRKEFHVSPFFDRSGEYECRFSQIDNQIDIHINLMKEGKPALISRWWGNTKSLTSSSLWATLLRYPLSAWMTLPRIHWQAAILHFGKKIKHYKKPPPLNAMTLRVARPKMRHRIAMKLVLKVLSRIEKGKLLLILPQGEELFFGQASVIPAAIIRVRHYDFFWKILKDAGIGLGEAYMDQDWESPDVLAVLTLLIENKESLSQVDGFSAWLGAAVNRLKHLLRKNTLKNSRKNIREHYDLSNDFFELFLDPSMLYSCAIFSSPDEPLEQAQRNKLHRLLNKLELKPGHHLLEIGCGWGTLAIEAAKQYGCRVTGLTLSTEQLAYARKRIAEAGLENQIELRLCDYRNLTGQFDRIISVEMLEAVGHEYFDAFFRAWERLLKKDGIGVFQVITIPDQRYEAYRRGCDFIQKHIFPGALLPSLTALAASLTRSSELMIEHVENIGPHYALTLRKWREAFLSQRDKILSLGFDERFVRKWEYYFLYCEAGFQTRYLNDVQVVLTRAGNRSLSLERTLEKEINCKP